jgi:cysteine-rich repeat protein
MGIGVETRAVAIVLFAAAVVACNGSDPGTTSSTSDSSTSSSNTGSSSSSSTSSSSTTDSSSSSTSLTTTAPATDTGESSSTSSSSTTDNSSSSSSTGPAPFCGDGVQDPGEACDDGNFQDDDSCTSTCKLAVCGDGLVQLGVEECDDGNQLDDDDCNNACISKYCTPSGQRAALDTLGKNGASGCWDGNPCDNDLYSFIAADAQNFQAFGESISCTGATACVAHVGIATFEDSYICQGRWDVHCDGVLLGTLDTLGKPCVDSAMGNGCSIAFEARKCAEIELRAALDADATSKCCEGNGPDSMIVAVSAW